MRIYEFGFKKYVLKDIINLLISINNYNMSKFTTRRSERFGSITFPKQMNNLESNISRSLIFTVSESSPSVFLVEGFYIVKYNLKKISCKRSFEFGYPCCHLCAVMSHLIVDIRLFISHIF